MTYAQVRALDRLATQAGFAVLDYRPFYYWEAGQLHLCYALILELAPGDEVACFSLANFMIRRFDRVFD